MQGVALFLMVVAVCSAMPRRGKQPLPDNYESGSGVELVNAGDRPSYVPNIPQQPEPGLSRYTGTTLPTSSAD